MTVHRVNSWNEFKALARALKPEIVYYLAEPHPLRKPPLGLRLTFYHEKDLYVFTDFADDKVLHKTGIHLTNPDNSLKAEIKEEEIRLFLSDKLRGIKVVSLPPFMY